MTIEYLRQFKLGGYAIFDFAASFLGIYLLAPLLSKLFLLIKIDVPKRNWLYLTIPLSVLVHYLVGNITPMTRDFMDMSGHYLLKAFILVLLIMGLKGVKLVTK